VHHLGRKVEIVKTLLALDGLDDEAVEAPRGVRGLARLHFLGGNDSAWTHLAGCGVERTALAATALAVVATPVVAPALLAGLLRLALTGLPVLLLRTSLTALVVGFPLLVAVLVLRGAFPLALGILLGAGTLLSALLLGVPFLARAL
jgi:hypothetical protein